MIDELGNPVLADFGKARKVDNDADEVTTTIEGTLYFLPPECCGDDIELYSMKKADIWSLGITMYCYVFNKLPFPINTHEEEVMSKIRNLSFSFEGRTISHDLKHFLNLMLRKNPNERASIEELKNSRFINLNCHD
jgi:[calcium/calmodulin-dependent protein kinase] kinase